VKQKYITAGVCNQISLPTQMMIWQLATSLPCQADYLQVFKLEPGVKNGRAIQTIEQSQEMPEYKRSCSFYCGGAVNEKLYLIDDGDHITLMMSEEY
jgi:hypothetical protein